MPLAWGERDKDPGIEPGLGLASADAECSSGLAECLEEWECLVC